MKPTQQYRRRGSRATTNQASRLRTAIAAAACAGVAVLGGTVASQATGSTDPDADAIERSPFFSLDERGNVSADFAADPRAAEMAAAELSEELDGRVITVEGLDVRTPEQRRADDKRLSAAHANTLDTAGSGCMSLPSVARGAMPRPFLGCPDGERHEFGVEEGGPPELALTRSFQRALSVGMPAAIDLGVEVQYLGEDQAAVTLPREFIRLTENLSRADLVQVEHALVYTAFTVASLNGVSFTVEGDCAAFGRSIGGDSCPGTIDLRSIQNMRKDQS